MSFNPFAKISIFLTQQYHLENCKNGLIVYLILLLFFFARKNI